MTRVFGKRLDTRRSHQPSVRTRKCALRSMLPLHCRSVLQLLSTMRSAYKLRRTLMCCCILP
uniref:Uncharacterized protein n=1 Tax=Hyaloperonospora arabidopsidis (strain Emoy2) TaxID=559515 RepID=M4BUV7_HYAAE